MPSSRGRALSLMTRAIRQGVVVFALTIGVLCIGPEAAQAQCAGGPCAEVEANYKGAIGLGLVGAELGFVIPAVSGLDDTWALVTFPVLGAAGGGVAGYYLLDQAGHVELSVASLAVGMALIIPSMVLTLTALSYDPADEPTQLQAAAMRRDRAVARSGALQLREGSLAIAVPSFGVRMDEPVEGRVATRVDVPLVSGAF